MGNLKKELEIKLEKILHLYIFAQEAYYYTEYFHNPETREEFNIVFKSPHSKSISFIMHLMFRTLINEVSKLFSHSENDKFRLESFVKSLSPSGHFRTIGISITHINSWELKLKESKEIIDNVLLLRSKLYAHTDNPLENYSSIEISFEEMKKLLDIAASILKEIYRDAFDSDLLTDTFIFDRNRFSILKLLAKAESERQDKIITKYRNRNR